MVLNFILQTKRQMNHVKVLEELVLEQEFRLCFLYLVDIHTAPLSLIRGYV